MPHLARGDRKPETQRNEAPQIKPRHSGRRPRIAAIYTEFRESSHAYHILEAHMGPYLFCGELTDPGVDVVSFYADQFPSNDMTRDVVREHNMPLFDSIAGALTLGGNRLAVDGVLLIGEHGNYPLNELGQKMYPRKRFFDEIVAVMDRSQEYVPIFNDKHLSYRWDWAREMYDTARERGIPFLAGSSVPLAQRIPDHGLPSGCGVTEAVSIHGGGIESYDFHGLEVLQSMVESRRGAERGLSSVQLLDGAAMIQAARDGRWSPELAGAAMEQELPGRPFDLTTDGPLNVKHGLLVEYRDGLRGVVLAVGKNSDRWNFACRVTGQSQPFAVRFHPGPWGNRNLFRALSHSIQELFITRRPPYPVERTLLVTGAVEAAMQSHHQGGKRIETPHLAIEYKPRNFDGMREDGTSWQVLTADSPRPKRFEPGDLLTLQAEQN